MKKAKGKKESLPHYLGHRTRLRERFIKQGIEALQDYEVVEMLLTFSIPQKDVKRIAKELIKKFGSIKGILDATAEELKSVPYVKDKTIELIAFIKEIGIIYQKQKAQEIPVSKTPKELIDYCIKKIGYKKEEEFRVIYLNSRSVIIGDELISEGTIDRTTVYPRKVMEKALKNKAYSLIFTHNHPNGNPEPSQYDINLTKALDIAARSLNIIVYDHIIVAENSYFSLKEAKLL